MNFDFLFCDVIKLQSIGYDRKNKWVKGLCGAQQALYCVCVNKKIINEKIGANIIR